MSEDLEKSKQGWDETEIALLKFCRNKGLTHSQTSRVLERSSASVAMMWMKVKDFENGNHNQGKFISDKIKRGLQLAFKVENNAANLEVKQRWLDKLSKVTNITYYVNPEVLKEVQEEAPTDNEAVDQEAPVEVVSEKPLFTLAIDVDLDKVGRLIKLFR